ncbi:MAG: CYTH domain-containing protein [Lachnospiraceae bacterium]|nr:CYTH domain-containing protein [Lachnospiraceae bacterium]
MKTFEIERKYLIRETPDLSSCPYHEIEQAYLCTDPVVRVRRQDEEYYLTYKARGNMIREEYNLPLTKEAYLHLLAKADCRRISKRRHLIPFEPYTIELDEFFAPVPGLWLAEVEFPSEEAAHAFTPPDWFGEEVTDSPAYHNSTLSKL